MSYQHIKKILVTGGAGFVGSHLCDYLIKAGSEVVCVDNFSTGDKVNIEPLLQNARFRLVDHDVRSPLVVHADEIYNLACPASPVHYQSDPILTSKINLLGAINVLDLAKRLNCRILQASTSEVYGDPNVHPQTEAYWGNVNPIGPRSCYDEGKRFVESLCFDYYRQHNVTIKVARIFNTYGPRMSPNDGRVVSNFIVQALNGSPITIYGEGHQTRSFCYVDDLVDGLFRLMSSPANVTGPINLGNPTELSVNELAETIVEMTGSRSRIVHKSLPADDPQQRRPDIMRARQQLGWRPRVSLREGLQKTIEYFDRILARDTLAAAG